MKRYLIECLSKYGGKMYNITYEQPKTSDNINALPDLENILNSLKKKVRDVSITNIIEIK